MAVPSYTTDLATIDTAEALTNWLELGTWTAGTVVLEPDFFIQGSNCIAKYMTSGGVGVGGMAANAGSPLTIPSPGGFFVWMMGQCPNNIDTETNGGLRLVCGNANTAFYGWKMKGKDTYTYGGWVCFVVDPTVAVDYTVGTPTADKQWFGGAINQLANAKGGLGIDVVRYGRGEARIANGSTADGYATFSGYATQNDTNANRWGLIQAIDGGYLQQGLVIFGYSTATDFRDSNTLILIANTKKVISSFNAFEVRQATSRVDLTSISFLALGTVAKGNWITTDNADINIESCTFTDMGTFGFLANSTINNTIFRRCGIVTQGGAVFAGCKFDNATGTKALVVANAANSVTNTEFISDGTGYALEGFSAAGSYDLTNLTFTNYAVSNGTTGNEAIHVLATTGTVTLNRSGGTAPSIHTDGAIVNVVASVTLTVRKVKTGSEPTNYVRCSIHKKSDGTEIMNQDATVADDQNTGFYKASTSYTAPGIVVIVRAREKGYLPFETELTIPSGGLDVTAIWITDPNVL